MEELKNNPDDIIEEAAEDVNTEPEAEKNEAPADADEDTYNVDDDFNDEGEETEDEIDQLISDDAEAQKTPVQRQYRASSNITDTTLFMGDSYEDIREKERRRKWEKIEQMRRNKTVVGGEITGAEITKDRQHVNVRVRLDEDFSAVIPDRVFFEANAFKANYYEASAEEQLTRRLERARHCAGAKIPFIIIGTSRDITENGPEFTIVGDRVSALKAKRDTFFNGRKKTRENDTATAQVLSVGEHMANLEVLGVECVIRANQITAFRFVRDCRDELKPGDELNVSIKRIDRKDDGSISLSVSAATLDNLVIAANSAKLVPGSTYTGFVRNYNKERDMYTVITSNKASIAVPGNAVVGYNMLMLGDSVTVVVTNVSANGVAYGTAMLR